MSLNAQQIAKNNGKFVVRMLLTGYAIIMRKIIYPLFSKSYVKKSERSPKKCKIYRHMVAMV